MHIIYIAIILILVFLLIMEVWKNMLTKLAENYLRKEIDNVDLAGVIIKVGQEKLDNFDADALVDRVWNALGTQIEPKFQEIYDALGRKLSE